MRERNPDGQVCETEVGPSHLWTQRFQCADFAGQRAVKPPVLAGWFAPVFKFWVQGVGFAILPAARRRPMALLPPPAPALGCYRSSARLSGVGPEFPSDDEIALLVLAA
jgi:hypothetical protein